MLVEKSRFESVGVELTGRLVLPDSGLTRAVVLCITGGELSDCETPYGEWQEYLAEESGLSSFAFNARGMGDSGGVFETGRPGYHPATRPANSQASRALDTIHAYHLMMTQLDIRDESRIGVIGGSMGGDIALHTLHDLSPAALLLRSPSAYHDKVHNVPYGPAWRAKIKELGGTDSALESSNFKRILALKIPMLLINVWGDTIIPAAVRAAYEAAVIGAGGKAFVVGDPTTPHTYINARLKPEVDTPQNAAARQRTYELSSDFFASHLRTT